MSGVVIVGAQWGDEGKGKVTDYLASRADVVVRYQGGSNAGHTVVKDGQEYRLHLVPSGILYPDKVCVIGNGLVVDPVGLCEELDGLQRRGLPLARLYVSDRAHILLPCHIRLDEAEEQNRDNGRIGTTGRGIGPAYTDKVARIGLRAGELMEPGWEDQVVALVEKKNLVLKKLYGMDGFPPQAVVEKLRPSVERLRPLITDTSLLLNSALKEGKNVLFEGAQGTLLDLDHGTYPYVTSSSPTAGGACTGSGVGPTAIDAVYGVCKAYLTRVGEGPFPTELHGETCRQIRDRGKEYGTTTGRPRRCGWLDLVMLRYTARVNGLTGLLITRLDVLDEQPRLLLCTGYRYRGELLEGFPASLRVLRECEPVYEEMEGWQQDTSGARRLDDLPPAARRYLDRISEIVDVPVAMVSVGPQREQTIVVEEIFPGS